MAKLVITEYVSLDGVYEDPGGSEGFEHGGWTRPYWGDDIAAFQTAGLFASDALLFGRVTYEGFAAAWPAMRDEAGFADRMNSLPKHVVSTTLEKADWNNSHVISTNVAREVARLKERAGGDILVYGSGALVQTLIAHDLIDEYRLLVYPVLIGSGKRLFRDGSNTSVKPVETRIFESGVVLMAYEPAGKRA